MQVREPSTLPSKQSPFIGSPSTQQTLVVTFVKHRLWYFAPSSVSLSTILPHSILLLLHMMDTLESMFHHNHAL